MKRWLRVLGATVLVARVLGTVALWAMLSCHAVAEVYKWTDKHGVVHYSDNKPKEKSDQAAPKVETVTLSPIQILDSGEVKNTGKENDGWLARALAFAEDMKYQASRRVADLLGRTPPQPPPQAKTVDLYTTSWCGYCKKARGWLREQGIPFREYDIQKDSAAALRMRGLGGNGGVPFAVFNGKTIVRGFSESQYREALR